MTSAPQRSPWTAFHSRLHQRLRLAGPSVRGSSSQPALGSPRPAPPGAGRTGRPGQGQGLLPRQQAILIAVSGGQDSVALARLLWDLQPKWDWPLALAHCNHRWHRREDEAAQQVQQLAETWGLPFYLRVAETPPRGELEARRWRYAQLVEMALQADCPTVVTGHTASDRAETLLHNLARGAGLDGLGSLTWERPLGQGRPGEPPLRLVRPLLGFSRADTAAICDQLALPVWQDPVNDDLQYTRNRLRHRLLPHLAEQINPQAEAHLAQTAELVQADIAYLEQQAQALRQRAETGDGRLDRRLLEDAPLALQRRVVRQFLRQRLPHQPDAAQIEKTVALLTAPRGSQTDPFPGGQVAQVEEHWVRLRSP